MEKNYSVYILSNTTNKVLYIGVTNDLSRRVWEHKEKSIKGFTSKYNVSKLVYYEVCNDIQAAIQREKRLKKFYRVEKIKLIEELNKDWKDLYFDLNK
jgi:putative endonuclease